MLTLHLSNELRKESQEVRECLLSILCVLFCIL